MITYFLSVCNQLRFVGIRIRDCSSESELCNRPETKVRRSSDQKQVSCDSDGRVVCKQKQTELCRRTMDYRVVYVQLAMATRLLHVRVLTPDLPHVHRRVVRMRERRVSKHGNRFPSRSLCSVVMATLTRMWMRAGAATLFRNISVQQSPLSFSTARCLAASSNVTTRPFAKEAMRKPSHFSDSDSDSDSEGEHVREKGNSEFWRRKIRTFHGLIDINDDGVVSIDDFKILAERFINLGHLSKKQEEEFMNALQVVWEEQWGIAHPYNMVTAEQYLENMHHVINDKSLKRKAHHFLPHLFQAVDKDKSGDISLEEFTLFFECLGLDSKEAVYSFASIDANHDGNISKEEFVKLGREYFLTEDETRPSKYFWGPLIKP